MTGLGTRIRGRNLSADMKEQGGQSALCSEQEEKCLVKEKVG